MMGSSEILKLIAENDCHILVEHGIQRGQLKRDLITVRVSDGRNLGFRTPQGFESNAFELLPAILDDYIRQSFVARDGSEFEDRIIYRLTEDGRKHALT